MKYIDLTLPTPAENLACDEALLDWCEEEDGPDLLRFWEPAGPFVVVGYANQAAVEVNLAACRNLGIPVFRRTSGGGTVLQGRGCLNYALVLRFEDTGPLHGIATTNHFILERHGGALAAMLGAKVERQGATDLATGGLKFSGNAQRRKRRHLLFHGTFLLRLDISLVAKVLPMPSKQPAYRRDREHGQFLTNLDLPVARVKEALRRTWKATAPLERAPEERIRRLVEERYGREEWNLKF